MENEALFIFDQVSELITESQSFFEAFVMQAFLRAPTLPGYFQSDSLSFNWWRLILVRQRFFNCHI